MVSRSEACRWLILIEKPQRRFGLGKKKKSEESRSASNCVRDRERHSRKACTDTHFWTEPWCKANQSDQHPVSAQSRHTYESIFISMAWTADGSQEQRIADLGMIARSSGLLCLWWVDNMLSLAPRMGHWVHKVWINTIITTDILASAKIDGKWKQLNWLQIESLTSSKLVTDTPRSYSWFHSQLHGCIMLAALFTRARARHKS